MVRLLLTKMVEKLRTHRRQGQHCHNVAADVLCCSKSIYHYKPEFRQEPAVCQIVGIDSCFEERTVVANGYKTFAAKLINYSGSAAAVLRQG